MTDVDTTRTPSIARRLLAIYIDYLVFAAAYQPIAWTLRTVAEPISHWLVALAVFAVLRTVASRLRLVLPGKWALGISPWRDGGVEPQLLRREKWWTMAAGTLLVLEGSKNAVRWTQGLPIEPLLGPDAPQTILIILITVLGALNIVSGLLTLRTRVAGPVLGAGVLGVELVASIINRDAFKQWTADAVVARRALQGIAVRPGEVELMQWLTLNILPVALLLGALWLLAAAARFKKWS